MGALQRIDSAPDLTEQVYHRLLSAICAGTFAPGARITQEELAASLNVSRQPVLQALRLLKREGFVIDAGRRGLMVAPLDGAALEQLYEVRGVLDGLAARRAAASGAQLDASLIEHGRQAVARRQLPEMIEADMKFHQAIYRAAGNPVLAETAARHWHHIGRAMGAVLLPAAVRAAVWDEHEAILAAIHRGDARLAEALARRHCEAAGKSISSQLETSLSKEASL